MAKHAEITAAQGTLVSFCDPASPRQRGLNENAKGLLRQYVRKGADLSTVEQTEGRFAAEQINGRPRAVRLGACNRAVCFLSNGCCPYNDRRLRCHLKHWSAAHRWGNFRRRPGSCL